MASRTKTTSSGLNIGPSEGGNAILAAWQGLYWLFGARVNKFEITPEGVSITGLTFGNDYDASTIIADINRGSTNPRLDLIEVYPFILGVEPPLFENPHSMTAWMTRFFKVAGEKNSPQYVKDAITKYKLDHGIAVQRGRPRKIVKIDMSNLSPEALAEVPEAEKRMLMETLESLLPKETTPEVVPA